MTEDEDRPAVLIAHAKRPLPGWPRGMRAEFAAAYVGLSISSFRTEVARGRAPKPINLTLKRLVWLKDDLDGWLDRLAGRTTNLAKTDWQAALDRNRR
jgi:predicted DNA-binding transcriptional regulator AlpA